MIISPVPLSWHTDKELERQAAVLYELEAACSDPQQAEAISIGRRAIQNILDSRAMERTVLRALHDRVVSNVNSDNTLHTEK